MVRFTDLAFGVETDDIENLPSDICEKLECGENVIKITGNQKHAYKVSYKEKHVGMCLTYTDASCVETISYDYNAETKAWVFNSKDITPLGE